MTPSQRQAFDNAAARWESHLTGDLLDVNLTSQGYPVCGAGPVVEWVDDLVIRAIVVPIDGPGGILGQAGPCAFRVNLLPAFGLMQFDSDDLAALEANNQLDDVILHEMGHVLGFGTIWGTLGLRLGTGTIDPRFTGGFAIQRYMAIGGTGAPCDPPNINTVCVPLEGTGGPGTADSHWREDSCSTCQSADFFGNELMTGFISSPGNPNPLSSTSLEQFNDLGYPVVDTIGADPFTLNTSLIAPAVSGPRLKLVDDIWRGPVYLIEEDGTLTPLPPDRR